MTDEAPENTSDDPRLEEPTLRPFPDADAPTLQPSTKNPVAEDATLVPHRTLATDANLDSSVRRFGDYELLQEIARGGMGVVYKARQTSLNRTVALKMILAGQLAGEEDVNRFYAEAEAVAQLDHPGIVPVYEVGEHEGQHYFSMGYVDGGSLADRLSAGPLPPREAADYVKKIAEAIDYAHERGVIHRDLKPGNVLLDVKGDPKVTDFGLAKRIDGDSNLTATGQIVGTPSYMPPEQATGSQEEVTESADVYGIGAILYALLTGRPPFQSASPMETLLQVLEEEPVHPRRLTPTLPADLCTICLKCLQKEATKRYESCSRIAEDIKRWTENKPISAEPINLVERVVKLAQRRPSAAILLALTTVPFVYLTACTYAMLQVDDPSVPFLYFGAAAIYPAVVTAVGALVGFRSGQLVRLSMKALVIGLVVAMSLGITVVCVASCRILLAELNDTLHLSESLWAGGIVSGFALSILGLVAIYAENPYKVLLRGLRICVAAGLTAAALWCGLLFQGDAVKWSGYMLVVMGLVVFVSAVTLGNRSAWRGKLTRGLQAIVLIGVPLAGIVSPFFGSSKPNTETIQRYSLPVSRTLNDRPELNHPSHIGGWRLVYTNLALDESRNRDLLRTQTRNIIGRLVWLETQSMPNTLPISSGQSFQVRGMDTEQVEILVSQTFPGGPDQVKSCLAMSGRFQVRLAAYNFKNIAGAALPEDLAKRYAVEQDARRSEWLPIGNRILFNEAMFVTDSKNKRVLATSELAIGPIDESLIENVEIGSDGTLFVGLNPTGRHRLGMLLGRTLDMSYPLEAQKTHAVFVLDGKVISNEATERGFKVSCDDLDEAKCIAAALSSGPLIYALQLSTEEAYSAR